ncbi:VOC family protein [Bacillus sp. JCM 19034]|uniref:VOC family protein n=1 Tax=Bacillus sp. JCM 19034 TaxID=1481928 RepID=UPI000785CD95|nr:VOC family protein [Bacillus sp. JCM 19034]
MKLSHLNLTVNDVDASRKFLETYFDMKWVGGNGKGFAVLFDDDEFVLTLMKGSNVQYPKTFHIGFPQESRERVDHIYNRLKTAGYEASAPIESHGYTFYVQAPGGFTVEVIKRK